MTGGDLLGLAGEPCTVCHMAGGHKMSCRPQNREDAKVTITVREYNSLVEDSETLARLEAYGVDNWEGYGDALSGAEI